MNAGRGVLLVVFIGLASLAAWLVIVGPEGDADNRGGREITVVTAPVERREFTDIVEALGTARASESVTLTSRVADTVSDVRFDDGQIVKKGDVLVVLQDLEEQAQLREARANFKEAERQFNRTKDLVKQGNASTAALDAQQRNLDEARYRLDAAEARLADQRIVAPFDGLLGLRRVSEGTLINQTTPITTLDAIDLIYLDFTVPERFIATLSAGQTVQAKVEAYPGKLFDGIVKLVDSRVDPATRSVVVRAEVDNKDRLLRPGMLMIVEVISRTWQGLAVPEHAVVPTGGRDYIFVVAGDTATRHQVTLGLRRPGYVEVTNGIGADDKVVIEGTMRLSAQPAKVRDIGSGKKAEPAAPTKGGVL